MYAIRSYYGIRQLGDEGNVFRERRGKDQKLGVRGRHDRREHGGEHEARENRVEKRRGKGEEHPFAVTVGAAHAGKGRYRVVPDSYNFV